MKTLPKISIIGAGPGGLTAGMILAKRGFKVTIFEKSDRVGGRNAALELGDYRFDIGPTFLLQKFTLDEIFAEVGEDANQHLDFTWLDPMYRLQFQDHHLDCTSDLKKMEEQIKRYYPGNEQGLQKFMKDNEKKFSRIFPLLQKPYPHLSDLFHPVVLKAFPYIASQKSVYSELQKYFPSDELKLAFTFQSKYLGMSPWKCPQVFSILPYIEYRYGLHHVTGGLNQISQAMEKLFLSFGGTIHKNMEIKAINNQGRKIKSLLFENGHEEEVDELIINADFGYSMESLLKDHSALKRWHPKKLKKRPFSCSTFMLYLGLDKQYNMPHHTIMFAKDYKKNVEEITQNQQPSEDMSIYIHNPSILDPTLAPKGHSALYVLVPTINTSEGFDWHQHEQSYRDLTLETLEQRTELKDLRQHIREERIISPAHWQQDYSVYNGAVFNLAHVFNQMIYWRPRNRFESLDNCSLVGGGTHPGSGLPTIYESARISSNLICKEYQVPFRQPVTHL